MTLREYYEVFKKKPLVLERLVALDWWDGPLSGLGSCRDPQMEFWFWTIDERCIQEGQDERLLAVYAVPLGTLNASVKVDGVIDVDILRARGISIPAYEHWFSASVAEQLWQKNIADVGPPTFVFRIGGFSVITQAWKNESVRLDGRRPTFDLLT